MTNLTEFPSKPQPEVTISASVRSIRGMNTHLVDVDCDGGQLPPERVARLKAAASLLAGTLEWEKFNYRKERIDSHELCFEFNSRKDAKFFAESTADPEDED